MCVGVLAMAPVCGGGPGAEERRQATEEVVRQAGISASAGARLAAG